MNSNSNWRQNVIRKEKRESENVLINGKHKLHMRRVAADSLSRSLARSLSLSLFHSLSLSLFVRSACLSSSMEKTRMGQIGGGGGDCLSLHFVGGK